MPPFKTLDEVHDLVTEDDAGKSDHIVRVQELVLQHGRLFVPGAENEDYGFALTPWAVAQACQRLGIPTGYFNHCPPLLQDYQFNYWTRDEEMLKRISASDPEAASWLIRLKGTSVRGVLSARYERLDNRQVMEALLPALAGSRYQVRLIQLTRESFHLRLADPGICRDVLPGDKLLVGIHIGNSEVGLRAVTVDALVFRVVCENGLVRRLAGKSLLKQRHIHIADTRFVPLLSEAIAQAAQVATAFIEQMALAIKVPVPDPQRAIAHLGQVWNLTKEMQASITQALLGEPRFGQQDTLYGLVNAVTNAAQRLSIDDRFQLETLASVLIDATSQNQAEQSLRSHILGGQVLRS